MRRACAGAGDHRTRWVTIPPPSAARSRAGVDHDSAAKWISAKPPLKPARHRAASSTSRDDSHQGRARGRRWRAARSFVSRRRALVVRRRRSILPRDQATSVCASADRRRGTDGTRTLNSGSAPAVQRMDTLPGRDSHPLEKRSEACPTPRSCLRRHGAPRCDSTRAHIYGHQHETSRTSPASASVSSCPPSSRSTGASAVIVARSSPRVRA
jgi:hypothetical protein